MFRYYFILFFSLVLFFSFAYSAEVKTDKTKAIYYYQKSAEYINNGQSRLAVETLKLSIELDPSYPMAYMILGDLYAGDPIVLDYNNAIDYYYKFLSKKDKYSSVYVSDIYKKIADVYIEMSTVESLDEKKKIEILKKSSEFYEKSLEAPFSEDNALNKSLVYISLAYINTILENYQKALSFIEKSDPEISKYLPEYNFCLGLINMKLGKDNLAIESFEKIEKEQFPYYQRAKICLEKIKIKKHNENIILIILFIVFFILCMILAFVVYKYFYKKNTQRFSMLDLKEISKGIWDYRGTTLDTLEKISHFTSVTLMEMTKSRGAYFFFVNTDRTKLNILEGANAGEFDFSVTELNHSEKNSSLWFDRRGANPFLTSSESTEHTYLVAFPKVMEFIRKCNVSIGVPIYYSNWFIGMVYLANCENTKLYEKKINEIKMFSARMSHIIAENIDLNSVYIDQQTGFYNGLYYDKRLEELVKECESSNTKFSVLRILIDRYQNLEDIFGANYILTMRNIAIDLINEIIGGNLIICVISKCEFSVIVKDMPFDELYSKAGLLNKRISDIHLTYQSDYLSTSIAVGTFSPDSFDIETFKNSLESAFIFAINNGGNQVVSIDEFIQQEREKLLETAFEDIDENEFDFIQNGYYDKKEEVEIDKKEQLKEDIKEEADVDKKEQLKEDIKEEADVDKKEQLKEDIKEEADVDKKEQLKEDIKEEADVDKKEQLKEDIKEEAEVDTKELLKEDIKEEAEVDTKEQLKEENTKKDKNNKKSKKSKKNKGKK